MAITAYDILDWVTTQSGHPIGPDEGVSFGPARQEVRGLSVCWMPDPPAIRAAADAGHQLLIHHEALTHPYPGLTFAGCGHGAERQYLAWKTNAQRLTALGQAGLTSCRVHGSADDISIFQACADMLGLSRCVAGEGWSRVFEIEPVPYGELIERVKAATGMPALRATCCEGMGRVVRRVGMPWGGLGLFTNVWFMQGLIEHGLDVMIAGESDNYGMRFCTEVGVDLIETSHEISENPGLAAFAKRLAEAFPDLDVRFIDQPCVWRMA